MTRPWVVRQVGPPARWLLWWGIRAGGTDVTDVSARRTCLVLAAHPDDETLGCAATIMRKREAGTAVRLVIATDGRRSSLSTSISSDELAAMRVEETNAAAAVLGLAEADIVRLGFEDTRLADARNLWEELATVVDSFRPQEILVTAATDPHPDHAALGQAARRAIRDIATPGVRLLEYPVWQWRTPASWRSAVRARPELVSTAGLLDRKRDALRAYRSQMENVTGDPDWWTLDRRFLVNFLRSHEMFVPVRAPA